MKKLILIGLGSLFCRLTPMAADANLPKTPAELNAWYVEPQAGENAATFCLKGLDALKITDADTGSRALPILGQGQLPPPDEPLPLAMKSAIAAFVERNKPAISQFEQAANLGQCRYPIDLKAASVTKLPHLAKIRRGVQMLELAALSDAVSGQRRAAGYDIVTSLALGESLKAEPLLISQLVRISCASITVNGLEQVVNRTALPAGTRDQLQKSFSEAEASAAAGTGLRFAIIGERVMGLSMFDMKPDSLVEFIMSSKPGESREAVAARAKSNRDADRKFLEATYDDVLTAVKEDYPQRLKAGDIFDKRAVEASVKRFYVSGLTLPSLSKAISRDAVSLAQLRLAQTAVALEQFRALNENHYPDSLNQLVPTHLSAVPKDPFSGEPLKYRKAGSGYVLYSIGGDLKDDGGRKGKPVEGDIVFSVVNPPTPAR